MIFSVFNVKAYQVTKIILCKLLFKGRKIKHCFGALSDLYYMHIVEDLIYGTQLGLEKQNLTFEGIIYIEKIFLKKNPKTSLIVFFMVV